MSLETSGFVPKNEYELWIMYPHFKNRWHSLFPKIIARSEELGGTTWTVEDATAFPYRKVKTLGYAAVLNIYDLIRRPDRLYNSHEAYVDFPVDNEGTPYHGHHMRLSCGKGGATSDTLTTTIIHDALPVVEVGKASPDVPASAHWAQWDMKEYYQDPQPGLSRQSYPSYLKPFPEASPRDLRNSMSFYTPTEIFGQMTDVLTCMSAAADEDNEFPFGVPLEDLLTQPLQRPHGSVY